MDSSPISKQSSMHSNHSPFPVSSSWIPTFQHSSHETAPLHLCSTNPTKLLQFCTKFPFFQFAPFALCFHVSVIRNSTSNPNSLVIVSCFKVCTCSDIQLKLPQLKKLLLFKWKDSYFITMGGHGQLMTNIQHYLKECTL